MKKIKKLFVLLLLTLFLTVPCGVFTKAASYNELSPNNPYNALFHTIDYARDLRFTGEDIKSSFAIFSESYVKNSINSMSLDIQKASVSKGKMSKGFSIQEFEKDYSNKYGYKKSASGTDIESGISGTVSEALSAISDKELNNARYFYAVSEYNEYVALTCSAPYFMSNVLSFSNDNIFDPIYLKNLNRLFNDQMSYRNFFQMYGTHFLTTVKYGGYCEAIYTVSSQTLNTINSLSTKIDNGLSISLAECAKGTYESSNSISARASFSNKQYHEHFYAITVGGNEPFVTRSFEDLNTKFSSWANSFKDYSYYAPIGTVEGGLIPIWEMLPYTYRNEKNINKLKEYYYSYLKELKDNSYANYIDLINVDNAKIRINNEILIKNYEYFNNDHDTVDLDDYFEHNFSEYVTKHEIWDAKLKITVELERRTEKSGTHQFAMCYDYDRNGYKNIDSVYGQKNNFYEQNFETVSGETGYSTVIVAKNVTVPIIYILANDSKFYLRYAQGSQFGNHRWRIRNVTVKISIEV